MKLQKAALATLAAGTALVSATAFADNGRHDGRHHWKHGHHGHHGHHHHHHAPRPVFMAPPRVVYAPPPRVVYAPPVVYPAPVYYQAPRYYQPAPVYVPAPVHSAPVHSGVSISFRLPL